MIKNVRADTESNAVNLTAARLKNTTDGKD
jgi:hypothetical protein